MVNWQGRDWQQSFELARWNQRMESGFTRGAIAVLLPLALYFYSPWLALAAAVPCSCALCWYVSHAIRRFIKRPQ